MSQQPEPKDDCPCDPQQIDCVRGHPYAQDISAPTQFQPTKLTVCKSTHYINYTHEYSLSRTATLCRTQVVCPSWMYNPTFPVLEIDLEFIPVLYQQRAGKFEFSQPLIKIYHACTGVVLSSAWADRCNNWIAARIVFTSGTAFSSAPGSKIGLVLVPYPAGPGLCLCTNEKT